MGSLGEPRTEQRWYEQRYLSEHWGRTMAAQADFAIDDYRDAVREAIRDLLEREAFGPVSVTEVLARVAIEKKADYRKRAQRASENRTARMKANGGCPICADAEKPDPAGHGDFHKRMTGVEPSDTVKEPQK